MLISADPWVSLELFRKSKQRRFCHKMDINPDTESNTSTEPSTSTGRPARKRKANSLYADFVQIPQNDNRRTKN